MEKNKDYFDYSYNSQHIENAFKEQNELIDNLIYELYNYDFNNYSKKYTTSNSTLSDLSTNLIKTTDFQKDMLNSLYSYSDRVYNSYDYNDNLYQKQLKTNNLIKKEKDLVNKRYEEKRDIINNNQRQHEIYQYNYYKNKAQLRLIKVFIFIIFILIFITYINKKYNFIINDTLYTILLGTLTAVYVIYTCKELYDIYLRNEFVFDEYDSGNKPSVGITDNNKGNNNNNNNKNNNEKCSDK